MTDKKMKCPYCNLVDEYKLIASGNVTELKCLCGCTILKFSGVREGNVEKWDFKRKETPAHRHAKDMMT